MICAFSRLVYFSQIAATCIAEDLLNARKKLKTNKNHIKVAFHKFSCRKEVIQSER